MFKVAAPESAPPLNPTPAEIEVTAYCETLDEFKIAPLIPLSRFNSSVVITAPFNILSSLASAIISVPFKNKPKVFISPITFKE